MLEVLNIFMFVPTIKAECSTFFIRESSCHDAGIYNFDTIPWKIWIFLLKDRYMKVCSVSVCLCAVVLSRQR